MTGEHAHQAVDDVTAEEFKIIIRKLRKKLRQIENLEKLKRPLTLEEKAKITDKDETRQTLLKQLELANLQNVSVNTSTAVSDEEEEVESSDLVLDHSELDQILDPTDQILDRTDQILDRTDQVSDPTAAGPVSDAQSPLPISEKVEVANGGTHTMDNSAKASVHNKACAVIDTLTSPKSKRKRGSSKKAEKQKCQVLIEEYSKYSWLYTKEYTDGVCLASNDQYHVAGSRDTTARVWSSTGELCHTLGEHTSTVTAVLLTPDSIITSCHDCSLRVWDIQSGRLKASHYLFSPLRPRFEMSHDNKLLIGTDGGKLQLYSLPAVTLLWEKIAHDEGVLALDMKQGRAVSTSDDGDIVLWDVTDNALTEAPAIEETERRAARCVALYQDRLYWGDDGINVKMWNSSTEELTKLRNHMSEHGSTDTLLIAHDLLYSSSYNLDTGAPSINVRMLANHMYVMTVQVPWYGPITCLTSPSPNVLACSGGEFAIIGYHDSEDAEDLIVEVVHGYHDTHTDSADSECSSDSDGCQECHQQRKQRKEGVVEESSASWCSLM